MVKIFKMSRRHQFEGLIRPHLRELYSYAYRLCCNRERAEDIVQDLVVRLYQGKSRLDQVDNLRPWLYKSLFRQYLNDKRSESRSPFGYIDGAEEDIDELEDMGETPEALTARHLQQANLKQALQYLRPEFREVLLIHDLEGFSVQEAADILDVPLGTVKSRVHRARNNLRKILIQGTELVESVFSEIEG